MILFAESRPGTRHIVRFEGRTFKVKTDEEGRAMAILERRERRDGKLRDETYWHRTHGLPIAGRRQRYGRKSLVRTVLEAAGAVHDHLPTTKQIKEGAAA